MKHETFAALEKGANVQHVNGEIAVFDSPIMFAGTALVVTERGLLQMWTAGELRDEIDQTASPLLRAAADAVGAFARAITA